MLQLKRTFSSKVLKYDLFNNESKYPDWNADVLVLENAMHYKELLYKDFYQLQKRSIQNGSYII